MLAVISLPLVWIGASGQVGAATGGFVHLAVILGGMASVCIGLAAAEGGGAGRLRSYGGAPAIAGVACIALAAWAHRQPARDPRPLPVSLRIWLVLYVLALISAGVALLLGVGVIMPGPIRLETSSLYGWIFLAAICSFAYPRFATCLNPPQSLAADDAVALAIAWLEEQSSGSGWASR